MRVAFWGTPEAAVPALRALLDAPNIQVATVVTNPDRPSGRGHRLAPPPVKVLAEEAGVEVWQPERPREVGDALAALRVDACAVVAYGALLPRAVLDAGGRGFVNLHFSLLPAWRGAAPVQAALLAGDTVTGVSCFILEEGMDTGPVLAEARTDVRPDETAGELVTRLARLGAPVLVDAVRGLVCGSLEPRPQDHARATYAPKITPADARLDFTREAMSLARATRAFSPVPGAHTTLDGLRVKVHRATALAADADGTRSDRPRREPGALLGRDGDGALVTCGRDGNGGVLRLDQVQPAGKARMTGAAFLNGYAATGGVLGG